MLLTLRECRTSSSGRGSLEGRVDRISSRVRLKWELLRRELLRMIKRRSRERRLPWITLATGILLWWKIMKLAGVLVIWSGGKGTIRRTAGEVLRILHVRLKWGSL